MLPNPAHPGPAHPATAPRGFTILEVVMASVLGLVVASACFAIFTALNKTDQSLGRRYHEIVELERLHHVMQRAFLSVVVTDQPKPPPSRTNPDGSPADRAAAAGRLGDQGEESSASGSATGGSSPSDPNRSTGNKLGADRIPIPGSRLSRARAGGGSTSGTASEARSTETETTIESRPGAPKPLPAPRMLLTPDPAIADVPMSHRLARMQVGVATQRFELVLNYIPVVTGATVRKTAQESDDDQQRKSAPDVTDAGSAVRGRFFLQPNPLTAPNRPISWTLFWQPLRAPDGAASADSRLVELVPAGRAVPIATDLAYCRWQVFEDRARKTEFQATWYDDLPAYVEMEVETVGGLWASWMFEIDSSRGQESTPPQDDDFEQTDPGTSGRESPGSPTPRRISASSPIGGRS